MTDDLWAVACPTCGRIGSLRLTTRLVGRPLGTWSLAGHQMKWSVVDWPALECLADGCDYEELAKGAPEEGSSP